MTEKFTGKERDAETGLDYFGARYMSAAQGRFTSADAPFMDQHASDPQSWNLYAYTRNRPLRLVDPNGRESQCPPGDAKCADIQIKADQQSASDLTSIDYYLGMAKKAVNNTLDFISFLGEGAYNMDVANGMPDLGYKGLPTIPMSNETQARGGLFMDGVGMATTMLTAGMSPSKPGLPQMKTVTSWADAGTTPDLSPGRWVQLGEATKVNYALTGLPGGKVYTQSTFPFARYEGPKSLFSNSVTGQVPASSLQWPKGGEFLKGVLGQRQIRK